jgi:hypothetical protein
MNGSTGKPHVLLETLGWTASKYPFHRDATAHALPRHLEALAAGTGTSLSTNRSKRSERCYQGWIMIDAWMTPDPHTPAVKGPLPLNRPREFAGAQTADDETQSHSLDGYET